MPDHGQRDAFLVDDFGECNDDLGWRSPSITLGANVRADAIVQPLLVERDSDKRREDDRSIVLLANARSRSERRANY